MGERMYRFLADYSGRHHHLRVACHPSESSCYFIAKILAFLLHYERGMTFSRGLCIGSEPAVFLPAEKGRMKLWIEVGSPGPKKLRQGISRADRLPVYGYGNPEPFRKRLSFRGGEEAAGFLARCRVSPRGGCRRFCRHSSLEVVTGREDDYHKRNSWRTIPYFLT
jgi:hypothetical protein